MTAPDHTSRAHAHIGPSSLKSHALCAGFEKLHENDVPAHTKAAAAMGTRIHEAVEVRNPDLLETELEVSIYHDLIRDLDLRLEEVFPGGGYELEQEIRLPIWMPGVKNEFFGTCDILARRGHVALLHDHKTGVGAVDAPPNNLQAKAYCVGVFDRHPELTEIHVSFSVPQRGELLVGVHHKEELPDIRSEIASILRRAEATQPKWLGGSPDLEELSPNAHCRFCCHQGYCPAQLALVGLVMGGTRWLPEQAPKPEDLKSPQDIAQWLPVARYVGRWSETVLASAKAMAEAGEDIPGNVLKFLGAPRQVRNVDKFLEVADAYGVGESDILRVCSIPLSKVERLVGGKAEKGNKGHAAADFAAALEDEGAVVRGTPRYSLVAVNGEEDEE